MKGEQDCVAQRHYLLITVFWKRDWDLESERDRAREIETTCVFGREERGVFARSCSKTGRGVALETLPPLYYKPSVKTHSAKEMGQRKKNVNPKERGREM